MKKIPCMAGVIGVVCLWTAGLATADENKDESGKGKQRREQWSEESRDSDPDAWRSPRSDRRYDSYFRERGYSRLSIPKGHYPPPGECRIWYPERPPGQQSPPGNCRQLRREVPPGAWLIRHPEDDRGHAHVIVFDERRPGSILVVGQFEIATGVFVRVVVDR